MDNVTEENTKKEIIRDTRTVALKKTLLDKLDKLKIHHRESYSEVIERQLDDFGDQK